jgi:hypothetical protein
VTTPPSGSSVGEKRRRPHEPTPENYPQEGAEPSASASIPGGPTVQLPSTLVTGTRRPRKKRKVAFDLDPATAQPPTLPANDVRPSSPNPAPVSTTLVPSSGTTERIKSSTQVPTTSGKPKSNPARFAHQDDETVVHPETSRKKGKKKKDGPSKETEPLPDRGKSAHISPSPETQVKRVRKKSKKVSPKPPTEADAVPPEILVGMTVTAISVAFLIVYCR